MLLSSYQNKSVLVFVNFLMILKLSPIKKLGLKCCLFLLKDLKTESIRPGPGKQKKTKTVKK